MKTFFFFVFSILLLNLSAKNLELTAELYQTQKNAEKKNVNAILKDPKTQKLFSARIYCYQGAASICSLRNYFEFQSSGYRLQVTPSPLRKGKKTCRIKTEIDWNFPKEGPFLASGTESFYEGTVIHSTRSLLPGVFSPLGINQSRNTDFIYIPALQYSIQPKKAASVFRNNSKWEITVKIQEEGKKDRIVRAVPEYHQGRFPAKNPVGIRCRMYNHRGISVLNMYYTHKRGERKNGTPVLEELTLTQCFIAPAAGKQILLADVVSYCFADGAAFSKLPWNGGNPIRYQVFLTVK